MAFCDTTSDAEGGVRLRGAGRGARSWWELRRCSRGARSVAASWETLRAVVAELVLLLLLLLLLLLGGIVW